MAYLTNAKVKLPNGKTKDTHKVPDMPVATITYDKVEGRFTHKDGTVRILTGGRGTMSVRQWHAYPSILPRELYTDTEEEIKCENKFDTL